MRLYERVDVRMVVVDLVAFDAHDVDECGERRHTGSTAM